MAIDTKANTKMVNSMAKESTYGQIVHATKANLTKESAMDKAVGNQQR